MFNFLKITIMKKKIINLKKYEIPVLSFTYEQLKNISDRHNNVNGLNRCFNYKNNTSTDEFVPVEIRTHDWGYMTPRTKHLRVIFQYSVQDMFLEEYFQGKFVGKKTKLLSTSGIEPYTKEQWVKILTSQGMEYVDDVEFWERIIFYNQKKVCNV